jgi:hypothetical protein
MNQDPEEPRALGFLLAVVLVICCALPFLLASGVSLAFIKPYWPLIGGALAIAGVVGFIWYVKRGWPRRH